MMNDIKCKNYYRGMEYARIHINNGGSILFLKERNRFAKGFNHGIQDILESQSSFFDWFGTMRYEDI